MTGNDRTSWSTVAVAVLGGVIAALHIGKLPPALPLMRAELGFGLVAGGFVVSLFNVLTMTTGVLVGGIAEQVGRIRTVIAGLCCLAAGGVLGALAQDLTTLMASRLIEGVGFLSLAVSMPAVILAATADRDQGLALGLWSVFTPLGMSLAMLAAPSALSAAGWRGLWWAIVPLCALAGIALLRRMRRLALPGAARAGFLRLVIEAVRAPGLLLIGLIFCLYAFQWMALMVWLPTFQTESLQLGLDRAALVTALVVLMNVPGCLWGGWLLRRGRSARALLMLGSAIMGLCALAIFLPVLPGPARILASLAFSFFGGLVPPSLFNSVPRFAPGPLHISAGNGLLMQGSALGQFAGAPLVALSVDLGGGDWRFAALPMLAACALAIAAAALMRRVAAATGP